MDAGRVVEHGSFQELVDPTTGTGAFREAYDLQARQFLHPAVPGQNRPAQDYAGTYGQVTS